MVPFRLLCLLALSAAGCSMFGGGESTSAPLAELPRLESSTLGDASADSGTAAAQNAAPASAVTLEAARNEWTDFTLHLSKIPGSADYALRLRPFVPAGGAPGAAAPAPTVGLQNLEAYQVIAMPVDANRASFVRHTGRGVSATRLPRALLPLSAEQGIIPLTALRDPAHANDPTSRAGAATVELWIDVHVPPDLPAGQYQSTCEIVPIGSKSDKDAKALVALPVHLTVDNFSLPNERHLQMISQLGWDNLVEHYSADFETVTPRLVNRGSDKYAGTVKTLDALMNLAQHHRLGMIVPRLQPTVKWPAKVGDAPPDIDWSDFDSLVGPWFSGKAFADHSPLNYWPLPEPDGLKNYDLHSRLQYWSQAATHFDQNEWLPKTSVSLSKITPGRATAADSLELSNEAAQLLDAHKRMRVTLPLEDDQVQLSAGGNGAGGLIDPADTPRLLTASPSLVFAPPLQQWPAGVSEPEHWLRTDLPGLVPYAGAGGDERDVRLWAWLAFLRQAKFVLFPSALPSQAGPSAPADPNELIWCYPGSWFGLDQPVPTVQLKWLRRAQQDFEYLWLARERGEMINAYQMAQLLTKPVEIQPGQAPDPTYTLMTGTTDVSAWSEARRLLTRTILLHEPGKEPDPARQQELYIQTLQWARPRERPLLMARTTEWAHDIGPNSHGWVGMRLGLDIYNASALTPAGDLRWTALPPGWEVKPQPVKVPELATYQVRRVYFDGHFNLEKTTAQAREPLEFELSIDGPSAKLVSPLKIVLPIAACERREGRFNFDGRLDDWADQDAIQDGPLVKMLDRSSVQRQTLQYAATKSQLYAGWAAENLYLAFGLNGVSKSDQTGRNFVDYQARRAWGEDLCELLIQPVYENNTLGPILHVVCKPNGSSWVERKLDPRLNANPWEPFESTGIRYASSTGGERWTGEVAVPWKILADPKLGVPTLLRFNFAQHRSATGESASWAGPVDFGRDDSFMGLLHRHTPGGIGAAGVDDAVFNDPSGSPGFNR